MPTTAPQTARLWSAKAIPSTTVVTSDAVPCHNVDLVRLFTQLVIGSFTSITLRLQFLMEDGTWYNQMDTTRVRMESGFTANFSGVIIFGCVDSSSTARMSYHTAPAQFWRVAALAAGSNATPGAVTIDYGHFGPPRSLRNH